MVVVFSPTEEPSQAGRSCSDVRSPPRGARALTRLHASFRETRNIGDVVARHRVPHGRAVLRRHAGLARATLPAIVPGSFLVRPLGLEPLRIKSLIEDVY